MGMILGHHIPGRTGAAPAADSCSYSVKSDDPTPEPFSTPGGSRRDVRFRQDGLRAWTHWTVSVGGDDTHQYDISPAWSLLQADWTPNGGILRNTSLNRSMEWHDNGTKLTFLSRWFSSFRRIDTFDHSAAPYDISGGLGPGLGGFTALTGVGEYMARWSLDGFSLFVDTQSVNMQRYIMTTAHDITTITGFDQFWNYGAFVGGTNTWDFSADHTRIYFAPSGGDIKSMDLTAPDDISAPFNLITGPDTDLPSNLQVPRGLNIRADTGDIILLGDQNNQRIRCWSGGVAPTTDADFNDVVLLLDFDGPDQGTNITDLSNSGHNETFFDNAQIDVTGRSLGKNTLLLDGAGDFITFPDSADWDFGTADFTIEFTVDFDAISTAQTFMGNYLTGAGDDKGISVEIDASNNIRVLNGDSVLYSEAWAGAAINTTFFILVSRSGTDLRVFIDGVQLGSTVVDSTNFTGSVQPWRIGTLDGAAQFVGGNMGSVRITKGVARQTSNFTVPGCFYPHDPVPASPVTASGSPSITKPTSAGEALVISSPAIEAGAPLIGPGINVLIPASPTETVDDRLFVYSNVSSGAIVDGTWTALATAPAGFEVLTKIAAGDATDEARSGSALVHAVYIKFTMKDIAGAGSWDFNAQSTLRNTNRTAFDCNSLASFGTPAPSCSFFAGVRVATGNDADGIGDFSDAAWNAPPNGGTILKVRTFNPLPTTSTHWSAISFLCEPTKVSYPTGMFWASAGAPSNYLTSTRGWRYDHD